MEDLLPQQPFFDRHEFEGNLTKHNEVVDKLHLVVQYSLIKQGEIGGKVIGTKKTAEKLGHLTNLPGPYLTLTSEEPEFVPIKIYSEKVSIRTIIHRGYSYTMNYIVADLDFEDITISQQHRPSDSLERHLTFFLAGPRRIWSVYEIRELSATGEIKTKVHNSKIELNEDFPFEIEVIPQYFYEKAPAPDNYDLRADVFTIHFKTKESLGQLSNEDFVNLGKVVADDLTLLVSFLSRHWVTWYRYQLITDDTIKTYVRKTRECTTKELNWANTLIEPRKSREFLKSGFSNLRKLRKEGFGLFIPILYFVSGNEAKYLEEQFTTLFLSLEKIKDIFALKEGLRKNLPDKAFRKLRSLVSDVIKNNTEPSKLVERIQEKIPELNRPSLRFVFELLFDKYNISWRDIYPPTTKFTLIKTRDNLFHSSQKLNIDLLVKELYRLQTLIERLLLRMLGWKDLSRSPIDSIKKWLTAVENDNNNIR